MTVKLKSNLHTTSCLPDQKEQQFFIIASFQLFLPFQHLLNDLSGAYSYFDVGEATYVNVRGSSAAATAGRADYGFRWYSYRSHSSTSGFRFVNRRTVHLHQLMRCMKNTKKILSSEDGDDHICRRSPPCGRLITQPCHGHTYAHNSLIFDSFV